MLNNEIKELTNRIKELREICDYSVEDIAKELSITKEQYEGYEQNGDIPISVIYELAHILGVDFTELVTGSSAHINTYQVVRAGKGHDVDRFPGYSFLDLAYRFSNKIMQPLLVTLEPSDKKPQLVTHKGQEFNMVLEGSVTIYFDDKELVLNNGDCIYFDPTHPHGQRCASDKTARFLTMIAE